MTYPAPRPYPYGRLALPIAVGPAFTILYDTGLGNELPDRIGYVHARLSTAVAAAVFAPALFKVRHLVGSTILLDEEFGCVCPVQAGGAVEGDETLANACGYPIVCRGDRVQILASNVKNNAAATPDLSVRWGADAIPSVTQTGLRFAYAPADGGGVRWRIGCLRPMKSCSISIFASAQAGAAVAFNVDAGRVTRDAVATECQQNVLTGANLPLVGVEANFVVTGVGADAALDQFVGWDYLRLTTANPAAGASGTLEVRVTTLHV